MELSGSTTIPAVDQQSNEIQAESNPIRNGRVQIHWNVSLRTLHIIDKKNTF